MSLTQVLPSNTASATPPKVRYFSWWLVVFAAGWFVVLLTAFPDPTTLMQRHWPLILVGVGGAILGNATAVGGGLVFVPVMIVLYHMPAEAALKLALATQAFGMTSGAIAWLRRGVVPIEALYATTPALLVGATVGTVVIAPSSVLVKSLFGPASILIGLTTLLMLNRSGNRLSLPHRATLPLIFVTLMGGLLTGWIAIGVGEVVAAFLMLAYGLRIERCVGLGVVLLAVGSIYLTLLHQATAHDIPWDMTIFTILGAVFGARSAPFLTQYLSARALKLGFATVAIVDGFIFVVQSYFV
ncbi:MAG: sulfite exporter TauE/SafE family protein [Anaerolineae bacterium]|nr:sulfite exporter TauE/SafE family protein [Anaerolineae bacterium]